MLRRDWGTPELYRDLIACFFLCVLTPVPGSALYGGAEQRTEIQDLAGADSPVQISGHMMLGYDEANRFPLSYQESLSIKNTSPKAILLLVVHLQATSGPAQDEKFSQEYFFGDALKPGEVEAHDFPEQRFGATAVNGEPVAYKPDPHPAAQAHAEFVQFIDGSTWGDADSAEYVLDARRRTLAELDLLEHIYEQKGEDAFLAEIAQTDDSLDVLRQLKSRCSDKARYANCTHDGVHRTLVTAREHEEALPPARPD